MKTGKTRDKYSVYSAWRSILVSSVITVCMFIFIPFAENLFRKKTEITLRSVETVDMPKLKKELLEKPDVKKKEEKQYILPKPELEKVQKRLLPLQVAVSLNLAPEIKTGDFDLHFMQASPEIPSTKLVFDLAEVDRSPHAVYRISPLYPFTARRRGLEGKVLLKFIVKKDGTVGEIQIMQSEPKGVFDTAAVNAVQKWRFNPAVKKGEAVNCWMIQPIRFELEENTQ